ncbi:MAG: hypothetical protein IKL84_00780 [Clostridia bacterium]|nr:hypothetical protein [Clostridia bacterium]
MNPTETIKDYILTRCRMDAVGIAPVSALADEPAGKCPEDILPGAKSIIVFLRRIPDGAFQAAFRAHEDGNPDAFSAYAAYARELTPNMNLFFMQFHVSEFIETRFGHTAVAIPSGPMQNVSSTNLPLPAFVGPKQCYYLLNAPRAAMAAGLGEIGWNNAFLSPEFGPRQAIGLVLTTMELDCDAPYTGEKLCDPVSCGICSKVCPMGAIPSPEGESEELGVCGRSYSVGKLNVNACAVASLAFRREFSGKLDMPDLISGNAPSDEELAGAFARKPINDYALGHHPNYFCDKCTLYCPVGRWRERFGDTGLSSFGREESVQ